MTVTRREVVKALGAVAVWPHISDASAETFAPARQHLPARDTGNLTVRPNSTVAEVTNSFGQTHDVKNLFVVDGSTFVSASCQNPTWTILAPCWRAMDYLKGEMKSGNV